MSVIPLFTEEELERIEYYRSSTPGMQKMILEVVQAVSEYGENQQVKKEAKKLLGMLGRRKP